MIRTYIQQWPTFVNLYFTDRAILVIFQIFDDATSTKRVQAFDNSSGIDKISPAQFACQLLVKLGQLHSMSAALARHCDERGENRPFYLVIAIWPQKSGKLGQT